jgi:hypothetical protein
VSSIGAKIFPNSRKRSVLKKEDGTLEVRIISIPEKGKANKEAEEAVAEFLGVPKSSVSVIKGKRSKTKIFEIDE